MNQPLVTIGIPSFKGKYFKEALECWMRQTYSNFEVYIQDDASPDDLKSVFDEVCADDSRFHYERNDKNSAPYFVENWMKTLNKANGEFFVLASDDDLYEPEYLEEMVALAKKHSDVDFFDCSHDLFNEQGTYVLDPSLPEYLSQVDWVYALVYHSRCVVAQSVMCRTASIRVLGGFDNLPAAWGACDWLAWCKLAKKGAVTLDKVLVHWRGDGGNTTSSVNRYWLQQKLKAIHQARGLWRDFAYSLKPCTKIERYKCDYIKRRVVDNYFGWFPRWTFAQLPFGMYVAEMYRQWRDGDVAIRAMLGAIRMRAIQSIKEFFHNK